MFWIWTAGVKVRGSADMKTIGTSWSLENGFSISSYEKEEYRNPSAIEQYLFEDDPRKNFLVIGRENQQDATD